MYRDIPEELRSLIEPVVEGAGLELLDVVITRGRPPWQLRITIDTQEGDGRVPVDRCAEVSREIETNLDVADAIPNAYRLEVSSPGLDRVLAREKDFVAARGCEVRVETRTQVDGRRRFRGVLKEFRGETLELLVDGQEIRIAFADVSRANTIYNLTAADFAGEGAGAGTVRRRHQGTK